MKPPCPDCGHIHTATDTAAVRRFEPTLARNQSSVSTRKSALAKGVAA